MVIFSELTGQKYKSVDECLKAEEAFKAEQEAKKKAEEAKKAEAAKKQKEIDDAYEKAMQACDEYLKLVGIQVKRDKDKQTFVAINNDNFMDGVELILDSILDF